ncbi:hypothetical protein OsI_19353 [Oryza sativa Indica Group]|uniref:Os05g0299100 protein n=2 Tax=Oryza sativa TaxID=4530 RepID=Q0DJD2_ORYSJ|nr:hypothetical protein OsI_19353 [Oryza sativa Indica Group]EEE63140.1 hypothetical protein OsJ_17948 [Oryza sativa Japonica Group]BAF17041.1 Os05g0299100 [Oryza sativa Japonica Group]|eukprot:NP_001055127.1 Os05g0299100 [Oryza sativa Japonica Group]
MACTQEVAFGVNLIGNGAGAGAVDKLLLILRRRCLTLLGGGAARSGAHQVGERSWQNPKTTPWMDLARIHGKELGQEKHDADELHKSTKEEEKTIRVREELYPLPHCRQPEPPELIKERGRTERDLLYRLERGHRQGQKVPSGRTVKWIAIFNLEGQWQLGKYYLRV